MCYTCVRVCLAFCSLFSLLLVVTKILSLPRIFQHLSFPAAQHQMSHPVPQPGVTGKHPQKTRADHVRAEASSLPVCEECAT